MDRGTAHLRFLCAAMEVRPKTCSVMGCSAAGGSAVGGAGASARGRPSTNTEPLGSCAGANTDAGGSSLGGLVGLCVAGLAGRKGGVSVP